MKPILIAGVVIVHLALLSYTFAIVFLHRHKVLSKNVTTFLILGVLFDIISTICMVIGSGHVLTLHGIIGYTSLAGMLTDTIVSLMLVRKYGSGTAVSPKFLRWSTMAYGYWIVAYFTGAIIVILR